MQQKWVIGNWKMNGALEWAKSFSKDLHEQVPSSDKLVCAVCPPSVYLHVVAEQLKGSKIVLGAQNLCAENPESGAFTGEVSAEMLKDISAEFVLVGHSERREYYAESDAVIVKKFFQAQQKQLKPVLCVGESLAQREAGKAQEVIAKQVEAVIDALGIAVFNQALIAYEPIWAIGTGLTASPEQAQEIHQFIRALLAEYSVEVAEKTPILYGGSVNAGNAESLFGMKDINGALVGGASLKLEEFKTICTLVG